MLSEAVGLRITRLYLANWRNFSKVDVALRDRNFLVGPNASGKSNFLDAFRFLRDVASVGGGFESAVKDRGGVSRIRSLAARRDPIVVVEVHVSNGGDDTWVYRVGISQDIKRRPIIKEEKVDHNGDRILDRPNGQDGRDPELLRQTHLEQVAQNLKFRPLVDFFASIRYYHIVPQLIRESSGWEGTLSDPFGGDFLEQILRTPIKTQRARLRRIGSALTVAVPQLEELTAERDPLTGVPHLNGRYSHWRPQGAWQNEADFSDGTLRLVGLLWALLDGAGPLLLEEPELSLHPEVIRRLPQVIARVQGKAARQVFASTHSPDLLRDPGIGSDEVFLFMPSDSGTTVQPGATNKQVVELLTEGLPLPEIVMPLTRPKDIDQLPLFPN